MGTVEGVISTDTWAVEGVISTDTVGISTDTVRISTDTGVISTDTGVTDKNYSIVEETSILLRSVSQRTLVLVGVLSSCLVFIVILCCLVVFTLHKRKHKHLPVPEISDPLLPC